MAEYDFETVDVFAAGCFRGNPLAVFTDASGLSPEVMQRLAAEMNLSETVFVLPPEDAANDFRLRIFNRTAEMAFAGHPTIGTAFVLGRVAGAGADRMTFEVPAGTVPVTLLRDARRKVEGARVIAPRTLELGAEVSPSTIAACLRVPEGEIATAAHRPLQASMGNPYVITEMTAAALAACTPDIDAFREARARLVGPDERFSLYAYHRRGDRITARMFAPLAGTWEDPATGSAAAPLAGLLLSLGDGGRARFDIHQGEAMGRPSLIVAEAWRDGAAIRASIEGRCVPVFSGQFAMEEGA